jgi:hypothetical protein
MKRRVYANSRKREVDNGKEISYYSAIYNGWLTTRLEHDKSILTLSTSAIGLLITLLITKTSVDKIELILFLTALVAFSISALLALHIFEKNSDLLEAVAKNQSYISDDKKLKLYDRIKKYCFYIGIILTFVIGLNFGLTKIKEVNMAKENSTINKVIKTDMKKSFQGVQNLKPVSGSKPTGNSSGSSGKSDSSKSSETKK